MNRFTISAALSTALLAATFSVNAVAQDQVEWIKLTKITIDQPMEIPGGKVLQPGSYWLRLLPSPSDRHVVQFLNDKQNHVIATVHAINNYRMQPTGKTVITFYEMPAGQPEAIRAWFYPGDNFGQEFVYKNLRAQQMAKTTNTNVQSEEENVNAENEVPQSAAPAPQAQPEQPAPAPAPAPEVAQNEVPPAPATPAPAPAPEVQQSQPAAPQTLPQTASDIPMYALLGFMSLGAALGLRSFSRRTN
jgi:hypothetical protein